MSRSSKVYKRSKIDFLSLEVNSEDIYKNPLIIKLANNLMLDGKKNIAYKIIKNSFSIIKKELKQSPIKLLETVIEKIRPKLGLRDKKVASLVHKIPVSITVDRSKKLGIKMLVEQVRKSAKEGIPIHKSLALEVIGVCKGESTNTIKSQERYEKLCDENKIFLHFINN